MWGPDSSKAYTQGLYVPLKTMCHIFLIKFSMIPMGYHKVKKKKKEGRGHLGKQEFHFLKSNFFKGGHLQVMKLLME